MLSYFNLAGSTFFNALQLGGNPSALEFHAVRLHVVTNHLRYLLIEASQQNRANLYDNNKNVQTTLPSSTVKVFYHDGGVDTYTG